MLVPYEFKTGWKGGGGGKKDGGGKKLTLTNNNNEGSKESKKVSIHSCFSHFTFTFYVY